jgi:putative transposase
MPAALKRYQEARDLHFVTFTCYHRMPHLATPGARELFERTLERVRRWYDFRVRRWYDFYVNGYVVMPEHVHLLISEPKRASVAVVVQMFKQIVSRKTRTSLPGEPFWQRRYYDFNLWSDGKFAEKM